MLRRILARWREHRITSMTREHDTYADAVAFCETITPSGYHSDHLTRYRAESFKGAQHGESPWYARLLLEGMSMYTARHQRLPSIVDFGGAMGEGALYLNALLGAPIAYTVFESHAVVGVARAEGFAHAAFITTARELREISPRPDMLFTNGALQHAENPMASLREALSVPYDIVVFGANAFNPNGKVVSHVSSLAWNGTGIHPPGYRDVMVAYPRWNIDEGALVGVLVEHGYVLAREANYQLFDDGATYTKDLFFVPN